MAYPTNPGDIIITEFFFNPSGVVLPKYVELFNRTDSTIDLYGWRVQIDEYQVEIDETFNIDSFDYAVFTSATGKLQSSGDITYCSIVNNFDPLGVCESTINNLYWKLGTFPDLSNISGTIKILDNSNPDPIDSVVYNDADFPVGDDILGRAAVFIINPRFANVDSLNDGGHNWRSSEHVSDYLWNGLSGDFGSPLSSNFITPSISIGAYETPSIDSTKNTICIPDSNVCRPGSDGRPGGYAAIQLSGSAINENGADVSLDSLYWEIYKDSVLIDSSEIDSLWHPIALLQDTNLTSSVYTIPLITRNADGLLGKTDTIIYIYQESNEKPSVGKLNGQSYQAEIHVFENTYDSLYAEVIDPELCSSINSPCNFDSLAYKSSFFDNSSPFIWTSMNSIQLSSPDSLITYFTAPQIDSLNGISANNNPDTLEFQFKVIDPFGAMDSNLITVIVHNFNEPPKLLTVIPDTTILEDTSVIFNLSASDPDGDDLIYNAETDVGAEVERNGSSIKIIPPQNFSGAMEVTIKVMDVTDSQLVDEQSLTITVTPSNDQPESFRILPNLFSYSNNVIDTSSFFVESDTLYYFRLPQNSDHSSIVSDNMLRFQWYKNNQLDPDMDPDNNGDPLHLFYRLEAILNDSIYIILKDSINHQDFIGDENTLIYTEINVTDEFPYYLEKYEDYKNNENIFLNVNGEISYKWRVIAQNYLKDYLGNDPYRISTGWDSTDFKIDLIQPEVSKMDIIINDLYPGYYDLLWNSSEPFLTDSTFLSINEKNNQFSPKSMLNPRKVTDNLFHLTGFIPKDLTSVKMTFDLQLRDNAMNSGERIDEISYVIVSPDSVSTLVSASDNVSIIFSKYSVSNPVQIIIKEENNNILRRGNEIELIQITPTVHLYPKELKLNNPASIAFNMSDYISSEFEIWQLVIVQITGNELIQLLTKSSDCFINARINALGDYAVFFNSKLDKPLPTKFELRMNYPNPFNSSTTIPIELPEESFVEVVIYNILGKKIVTLSEGIKSSGYHNILWNGSNKYGQPVSSGIYFMNVHIGQKFYHQKMMLLK